MARSLVRDLLAVGVLTRQRPEQFAALLAKLAEQDIPAETELHFIFVENDNYISVRQAVSDFNSKVRSEGVTSTLEIEPQAGIPVARNRVLDIANRIGADWLIFIDDDDLPIARNWISGLYQGCKHQGLNVGYGINVYPDSLRPSEHGLLHQGSNVIFEMAFLRQSGVRYNVNLPVMEDVQFGLECVAKGAWVDAVADTFVQIGGSEQSENARFCFRRARDEGMVEYGFCFRHLHVSSFHPIRTPAGISFKLLTAILNLLLAVLFVPGAKVRAARHAGIVAGAMRGSLTGRTRFPDM